jgi:galactokinase/mevalonate kinase-like predicted kinase
MALENLNDFFRTEDFAQTIVLNGSTIVAIFDHEYVEAFGIEGEAPVLTVKDADIPGGTGHGSSATVESTTYRVAGIQPDGTGISKIVLERAQV